MPGTSVLLKREREEIVVVSYEGKETPKDHSPPKVILDLPIIPTKPAIHRLVIQTSSFSLPKYLQVTKIHLMFIKVLLRFIKYHHPST